MAQGIVFVALLLSTLAISLQEDVAQDTDYDYYDDNEPIRDSEEKEETEDTSSIPAKGLKPIQTVNMKGPKVLQPKRDREELTTPKQIARYEVTELVIDEPDVSTRRVPIITNFTLTRPLNFAGLPKNKNDTDNVGANVKDEGDEIINSILIPNEPNNNKNNQGEEVKGEKSKFGVSKDENDYFSNFHPKVTFEEEFDREFDSNEDDFDDLEVKRKPEPGKGFNDHIRNFRKSIVNEFKSVINKHKDSFRKIVNGPISFFSKLHKKSSDLVKKLHNVVPRHKFIDDDQDDDIGHHDFEHDYEDD